MVKKNLKDHLTDDTLDLSLTDLQEVPVKEIAAFPKATSLDLSNNKLTTLSKSFAVSLTHLVKLDLARNELKELPKNFGLLVNLKHLDLYKNKLESLPLSFANLKGLRWLDLKENPLEPHWHQIVGPCLNAQDCKAAAKNVVNFASMVHEEIASELQLSQTRLKQQEENEENELREMAKKREKQREKKKRRLAAKTAEQAHVSSSQNGSVTSVEPICPVYEEESEPTSKKKNRNITTYMKNFCVILFKIFIYFLLIFALVIFVLQFVNEPVYNRIMARLSKHSRSLVSLVPGHTRVELHRMTSKFITNTKMIAFYLWTTSYKSAINAYVFITSDPKFETYVNTFILYFQYLYVTLCNSLPLIVNTVMQTVPS